MKNGPSKICRSQTLKYLYGQDLPKADYAPSKFLIGCLPQILLGPFMNALSHMNLNALSHELYWQFTEISLISNISKCCHRFTLK